MTSKALREPVKSGAQPRYVEMVRVSTARQSEQDTPEDQRAALLRLRMTRPGTLVARIDEAVSGAKDAAERTDVRKLFELAAAHAFDEVRVRHVDRLTRHDDARERFAIYGAIRDAGAVIVEASGRVIDPADEMGELDLTLQGWFAARERKRILERTLTAKKRKARENRLVQGQPPYGRTFDTRTGRWGLAPKRAETYSRMFSLCLEGRSLSQIAETLNVESAAPPTRVALWTASNVSKLLRDPVATGRYTTQGHTFEIPAIVNAEAFRAVAEKMRANNSLSGPKPTVFALLRKLAVCGVCGSPIYIQLGGGTPARIRYYYCRPRDPLCSAYHRVADVDARVVEGLRAAFTHPRMLARAAAAEAPDGEREAAKRAIAEAKAELRGLDAREERLARLVTKGLVTRRTGEKQLDEVGRARAATETALATAQASLESAERTAESKADLLATMEELRQGLVDAPPEMWREVVERLCGLRGGIRLFPDGRIEFSGALAVRNPSPPSETMSARRGRPGRARARRAGR
jgi:DNA invertase Pin-like site-specific DNA recombinase